jgi:crossover junction endonuclease MUS81
MNIELVIDCREKPLIDLLTPTTKITVEQLDLGDVLFRTSEQTIFIIERKSINDLKASICDGRHREQKVRLLGCDIPNERIMYLIEGNLNKSLTDKISGVPVSTLLGSLINTQLRDGLKVYKTASIKETSEFICKLFEKLQKDSETYFKNPEQITVCKYSSTLKKKKKSNMTPQVWFIAQLSLIPQITEKVAVEIVKVYPSVTSLVKEYEKIEPKLQDSLLADIKYNTTTGKTRRVGNTISKRVFHFFYNE